MVRSVRRLALVVLALAALGSGGCSFFFRSSGHVGGDAGADAATDAGASDAGASDAGASDAG